MDYTSIKTHAIDITKAIVGVFITSGLIAVLQYVGAHIPDLLQLITQLGGGYVGVKVSLNDVIN